MLRLEVISCSSITTHRRDFLRNSTSGQELFLESHVARGLGWVVKHDDIVTGYGVVNVDLLVEFYVAEGFAARLLEIGNSIIEEAGVKRIFCKSCDDQLVRLAVSRSQVPRVSALLYRNVAFPEAILADDIAVTPTRAWEIDQLFATSDGFFDSLDDCKMRFARDEMWTFRRLNGRLLGAGVLTRENAERREFDISGFVVESERNSMVGSYIVSYLKTTCLKRGDLPVGSASVRHVASQKVLSRGGLLSLHQLLEFRWM